MELGLILPENLSVFRPLLLPAPAEAIELGEPLTALGLTEGELAVGAAAGFLEEGYFQLISLYIAPDYRRRGGGRTLLTALSRLVSCQPGALGIELSYTATSPEHESLSPFLSAMGFQSEDDRMETIYALSLGAALSCPHFAKAAEVGSEILPFHQVPDVYLSLADKEARIEDVPLPQRSLNDPGLEREVSVALVKHKKVQAFVAFEYGPEQVLTLSSAWSGSSGPAVLLALLKSAARRAGVKYPPETLLVIQAVNRPSAELIRALLPGAQPISFTFRRSFQTLIETGGVFDA